MMRYMVALFLCLGASLADHNHGIIRGKLLEFDPCNESTRPLEGERVGIFGVNETATTDPDGSFTLIRVALGQAYQIHVVGFVGLYGNSLGFPQTPVLEQAVYETEIRVVPYRTVGGNVYNSERVGVPAEIVLHATDPTGGPQTIFAKAENATGAWDVSITKCAATGKARYVVDNNKIYQEDIMIPSDYRAVWDEIVFHETTKNHSDTNETLPESLDANITVHGFVYTKVCGQGFEAVANVSVVIVEDGTNHTVLVSTNEEGYFVARVIPGEYVVTAHTPFRFENGIGTFFITAQYGTSVLSLVFVTEPTRTVSGHVLASDGVTNAGAGYMVQLTEQEEPFVTKADGMFFFASVSTCEPLLLEAHKPPGSSGSLVLQPSHLDETHAQLILDPCETGVLVTGTVFEASCSGQAEPFAGAIVMLRMDHGKTFWATADDSGDFAFPNVAPGNYTIAAASPPNSTTTTTTTNGNVGFENQQILIVSNDISPVTFTIQPFRTVSGFVANNETNLVEPGVEVALTVGANKSTVETLTDQNGTFRFEDVVACESLHLSARKANVGSGSFRVAAGGKNDIDVELVLVKDDDDDDEIMVCSGDRQNSQSQDVCMISSSNNRLEIFFHDKWGSLCDGAFFEQQQVALEVCDQLGLNASPEGTFHTLSGNRRLLLTRFGLTGTMFTIVAADDDDDNNTRTRFECVGTECDDLREMGAGEICHTLVGIQCNLDM